MSHVEMDLPNDILFSILTMLPVKSVLRFMCLCKSWNSLIQSSAFIAAHNHHNENIKRLYYLYMPGDIDNCKDNERYTASSNCKGGCELLVPLSECDLVGVCEGLICLMKKESHNIYIWNPLVGNLKVVPPSQTPHEYNKVVFGFGFSKNDYRIVKIIYNDKWYIHEVDMYSLGANSWRIIECEPTKWWNWSMGVNLEGSIYWLSTVDADTRSNNVIVRFDSEEEIFEETAMPPLLNDSSFDLQLELDVVRGFLVLLQFENVSRKGKGWVKKESSWIASEEFVLPEDKIYPFIKVNKSGHLMFASKEEDEAEAWADIHKRNIFAFEYNEISGWKLREMKISKRQKLDLVRILQVGYPCCHAIAACNYHKFEAEDFVDDCLKKDTYLREYRHMTNPVPGMHEFEESSLGSIHHPQVKTRAGRPKTKRIRDANDRDTNPSVMPRRVSLTHLVYVLAAANANEQPDVNVNADEQPDMPLSLHRVPQLMSNSHLLMYLIVNI
ncbi:hypothetical protein BUALT_Bualt18G0046400 [Buddleja alternifolia]|uniref:F-box domain-containing protein n=1 Tax=Buddleja alternifolia TaxID=168488 RepID=A0AAV6WCV9_9LAMI|nr:hypothetical protein BUALT_Bualt18G0046400 [Buddleja alternifolia]